MTADRLCEQQVFIDDELVVWRVAAIVESPGPPQVTLVRVEYGSSLSQLNHVRVLLRCDFDAIRRDRHLIEVDLGG